MGASLSKQLLWLHMNRLHVSFTLKSWAEVLVFMRVVYARPLPEAISTPRVILYSLWTACHWCQAVRSCCDKQEVRCHTCFNFSRLCYGCRRCTLAVAQHCPSPTNLRLLTKCMRMFNFREILICAFKIYDRWPQANIDRGTHCLHMHVISPVSGDS